MNIGVQCESLGQRCGIWTYSSRVIRYLNQLEGVQAKGFQSKYKNGDMDVMNIQYEPGMLRPDILSRLLRKYEDPVAIVTAHHIGMLPQFFSAMEGVILHDENQISMLPEDKKPWSYTVIPHPALVYPEKDKKELRKKHGIPEGKKVIGTMGFIAGTGKNLPITTELLLKNMKDDEFLYLITPFWKGGDMGRMRQIMNAVESTGKTKNFKIETDFMTDEEILNEKMQCCDLMYCWNTIPKGAPQSQSGSAADIYGSRVKTIVKDNPHFEFIGKQDKVLVGREDPKDFVDDILDALRTEDLEDVQDPTWLSWEEKIKDYLAYFEERSL